MSSAIAVLVSNRTLLVFALTTTLVACETKSPVGPSSVTPTTTTIATTTIPGTVPTSSTTSSTTTIPSPATTRTYVSFGQVPPNVPAQLSVVLQALSGRSSRWSLLDRVPFFETQADGPVWTVLGFYSTAGGGAGKVNGELVGTLDAGTFTGTLTAETPECVAEREFGGTLDPQFLRWSGGRTLRDCKGSPLGFESLLMLATNAPPPTTTAISSSTTTQPLQCSYSLSANGASVAAAGGEQTVGLTTGSSCGWSVQNFVGWITAQPASGSGAATIALTVAANPGSPRTATVVIAGLPFVVSQAAVSTTTSTSTTSTSSTTTSLPSTTSSTSSTTSSTSSTTSSTSSTTSSTSSTTSTSSSTTSSISSTTTIPTTTTTIPTTTTTIPTTTTTIPTTTTTTVTTTVIITRPGGRPGGTGPAAYGRQ